MERADGTSDSQGRTLVALLGVASIVVLVVAGMKAGQIQGVAPFVALLAVAVVLECASASLTGFGYLGLGFFVYLAAILRPASLYSTSRLPGNGDEIGIAAQAILMAFFAMVVAWVFRIAVLQDRLTMWQRAADLFINLLRVAAIAILVLHVPGFAVLREGVATLDVFSFAGAGALVLAVLVYYLFDRVLTATAVGFLGGDAAGKAWARIHTASGLLASSVLVLAGWLAVAVALGALPYFSDTAPTFPLVLGVLAGAMPVLILNRGLGTSSRGIEAEEMEVLDAALRGARNQIDTLRQREEALSREVQKKAGDLDMLFGMARDLGAATNLNDTLDIVLDMIRRMEIPFQSCVVFLLQDGQTVPVKSLTPYKEVLEMSHLLQLEEGLVRETLKTRRAHLVTEVRSSSEQRIFKDERSVVCAPLIVSKEPIGVIYLGAREPGTYTEDDKNTLSMLAAHAAPSVHTARLFEDKEKDLESERKVRAQMEAKNTQLSGLQKMVQSIGENMKLDHSLNVVVESVKTLIPEVHSVVVLLAEGDEDVPDKEFKPLKWDSPYQGFVQNLSLRAGEGLVGQAILHKQMIAVDDVRDYSHENILSKELSAIAAPLVTENETLGCLYVGALEENAFSEEAQSLVATISFQAALAIKNARLMDEMERMSFTDGLTGLYSHRYFKEQLKREVEVARRYSKTVCLVLVDTDKFKQYNDTCGHPAGDSLLQEIADILRENVRSTDIVCRQGGDEFALIMTDSPKSKAVDTAKRIRETFELRFAEREVRVTASIGVSCFPSDASSKEDLMQRADEALYRSKGTGRNRVSVAPTLNNEEFEGPDAA